jgi:hypothetical protein
MFLGHFGLGFAAPAVSRRPSLGTMFLAAQFIDLLWPFLLLFGVERVSVEPGNTVVTPLHFEHYPWSHSGLMVLAWGLLFGLVYFALRRNPRASLLLGALVVSHWLLDLLVHAPDLPLYPGSGILVGFGAWNIPLLTYVLEFGIFGVGVWYYSRATFAKRPAGTIAMSSLVTVLLVIYVANIFGPPPPDANAIGWVGLSQWLLIAWAYWVDNTREYRSARVAPVA